MVKISTEFIIALQKIKGIGPAAIKQISLFSDREIDSVPELMAVLDKLRAKHKKFDICESLILERLDLALDIINSSNREGINIISQSSELYPKDFLRIKKPPLLLNIKGNCSLLKDLNGIAVIGTRNPSEIGRKLGYRVTEIFVERGFDIVSGLALGCDSIGHEAALNSGGKTVAILAHGLDYTYPKKNIGLAHKILNKDGVLISEYLIGTKPLNNYFIERDRLQSGISKGVCVVETGIKGGTMHTVGFSIDQNKPLGCILPPTEHRHYDSVQGNIKLIRTKEAYPLGNPNQINDFLNTINAINKSDNKFNNQQTNLEF